MKTMLFVQKSGGFEKKRAEKLQIILKNVNFASVNNETN